MKRTGYVYILHFERKLAGHAQHYIGCTCDPRQRLITHATGRGARIVQAALAAGIGFRLGALGTCPQAVMRRLERQLKNWKGCEGQCEICRDGLAVGIPGTTPYCLDNIEWPQDSATLAKLAPPLDAVTVRFATDQDPLSVADRIRELMQANKHALGFIPTGGEVGVNHCLSRNRVVLALMGPVLVGYCLFTEDAETVRIHQCVVSDPLRGCGLGRRMVEAVRESRPQKVTTCKVRDDLTANGFWHAIAFRRTGTEPHETSGSALHRYEAVPWSAGAN